jgi:hypothetical protein
MDTESPFLIAVPAACDRVRELLTLSADAQAFADQMLNTVDQESLR